jgi:hypothetical protein
MKKIIQLTSFIFIALIFSVVAANAQSARLLRMEVPFSFSVGNGSFPSGSYELRITQFASGGGVLSIFNDDGKAVTSVSVLNSRNESRPEKTNLVFKRSGDVLSLVEICTPDSAFQVPGTD